MASATGIFLYLIESSTRLLYNLNHKLGHSFFDETFFQFCATLVGFFIVTHFIKMYFSNWKTGFSNIYIHKANKTLTIIGVLGVVGVLSTILDGLWFAVIAYFGLGFVFPPLFFLSYFYYILGNKAKKTLRG